MAAVVKKYEWLPLASDVQKRCGWLSRHWYWICGLS